MAEKKIVFIIPGYKHKPSHRAYSQLAKILKSEGYHPILITIPWEQSTISENTVYFLKEYKKIRAKKKYILGFSFGAMIAFIASTKVSACGVILCSLSPYFKEDLTKAPTSFSSSGTRMLYKDFSQLRCSTLAKQVKAKQILLLYGTNEAKSLTKRVSQVYRHISVTQKHLIPIKDTEHDIGDRKYLYTIRQVSKVLN